MFDKLGELLSEALDNGALPIQEQIANDGSAPASDGKTSEKIEAIPLPAHVKAAFESISIPEGAGFDEAKRIYHEKLMYYHPDRRNDNPVLQKVAKDKTEKLLKNWQYVEEWFKNQATD